MQTTYNAHRVVVTGLGIVAPNGIGQQAFWQATSQSTSGIRPLSEFPEISTTTTLPVHVAGFIPQFHTSAYFERKLANRTDRMTHFVLAAIDEAIRDAQLILEQEAPDRMGAVIANTMGGMDFVIKQLHTLYTRGPRFVSAYSAIAWLNAANIGQAAIRYGLQGYCKTPVNDTIGGLDAMLMASRAIQRGAADILITGGCEALLHPLALHILARQGRCYSGDDTSGYRPFDRRAAGLVLAEGAGICILEEYEHALRRGAPIYGEITGGTQTNDAHGLTAPGLQASQYARALHLALRQADLQPRDIAYISLDGHALPDADQGEVDALAQVFGEASATLPVSVPRSMVGHSYAAAGAIDTITALLALKHNSLPPTINCEELDPSYEINMVRDKTIPLAAHQPGQKTPDAVLLGGRGIAGTNVALTIQKLR